MTTAPIRVFLPNEEGLKYLWEKFDSHRDEFPCEIPKDPIAFCTWILQPDSQIFLVGGSEDDPTTAEGMFLLSGIQPNENAFSHIYIWGRHKMRPKDLISAAKQAIVAVMVAHNLHRISGITPMTCPEAKLFATRVGFKVEGVLRKAIIHQGLRVDAWVSGIIRSDLPDYFPDASQKDDTIKE
jgi:hypothetical protein